MPSSNNEPNVVKVFSCCHWLKLTAVGDELLQLTGEAGYVMCSSWVYSRQQPMVSQRQLNCLSFRCLWSRLTPSKCCVVVFPSAQSLVRLVLFTDWHMHTNILLGWPSSGRLPVKTAPAKWLRDKTLPAKLKWPVVCLPMTSSYNNSMYHIIPIWLLCRHVKFRCIMLYVGPLKTIKTCSAWGTFWLDRMRAILAGGILTGHPSGDVNLCGLVDPYCGGLAVDMVTLFVRSLMLLFFEIG